MTRRDKNKALAKAGAIADCMWFMDGGPHVHIARSGSVYVEFRFGLLRVSNHNPIDRREADWFLMIDRNKDKRDNFYGLDDIKMLIKDIKDEYYRNIRRTR